GPTCVALANPGVSGTMRWSGPHRSSAHRRHRLSPMSVIPADDPTAAPASDRAAARAPRLSIVIPVYNEAATVQELVRRVVTAPLPDGLSPEEREIVCVNDASADNTPARLDELPALFPGVQFRIIHKTVNQGKGAALRDG